jgi:hypothetical protein
MSKVGSDKMRLLHHEDLVDSFSKQVVIAFSDPLCISPRICSK